MLSIYVSCECDLFECDQILRLKTQKANVYRIKRRPFNELKKLNLNRCQITSIDVNCFNRIDQLETLNLLGNKLYNNLKADTFQQLKSLKRLDLSSCEISTIPNGLLTGLDRLETLDLNDNPIARLESNTFEDLKSLKRLGLSSLAENAIFEDGIFSPLESLESLYLFRKNGIGNNLKSNTFSNLRSLTHLVIFNCNITKINNDFFSNLSKLEELHLQRNNIDKLDTAMFTGLKQLRRLLLSRYQAFFSDGKSVTEEEFKKLLRNLTNKDVDIRFH